MPDAKAYHRLKKRYFLLSAVLQITFLSSFAFLSGGEWLLKVTNGSLVFISVFYLLGQVVLWPVRFFSSWRLEKDFGMLKQNFGGWLTDFLKVQALSFAFFVASALIFYAAVRAWPSHWWWALACFTFGFSAFFSTLFPVCILPLFYRSVPLKDAALIARLEKTLESCGFPDLPLFELKLGEKTARANAMLTGFGKTRRALLSDTLLANYTAPEIEMVLAHEAGHHARLHLARALILEAFLAAGAFFILSCIPAETLLDLRFFPALALLSYLAGLAALPLGNSVSRSHEKEADRFALSHRPDLETFRSLMEKLAAQNLADPSPGRWEEFFLYTHPSKGNRLAHAEKFVRMSLANSGPAN